MDIENSRYKEYTDHFSTDVSQEIKDYAINEAFNFSRYIFTRKDKNQQCGYCTHCRAEIKTEGLKHNEESFCPSCRSKVTVKSSGMGRKYMIDDVYFVYYEKSSKDPNVLIARGIQAKRDYRYDYHSVRTQYFLCAMYIFDANKGESTMLRSAYGNGYERKNSIFSLGGSFEQKGARTSYSRKSIEIAVKDTPFKYSTWESYRFKDMTEFFELYTKYPSIEYLTKEGYEGLVESKLEGAPTHRSVNWKGKSIFKILKVTKQDLKEIRTQKVYVSFSFLKVFQDAKKRNWNLTLEDTISVANEYLHCYDSLLNAAEYSSMRKLLFYFSKQYMSHNKDKNEKHKYYGKSDVLTTFRDYMRDCILLEMDTSKEQILFPRDLYIAHQNTIKQIKIQKNEKYDMQITNRAKSLKKYIFQCDGLMIRPAISSKELIEEGASLSHCVGTYADIYAKGETDIFLIRKVSELDKPYYTVEVKKDIIIQVRGKNNRSASEDVAEFIKEFTEEKLNKKTKKNRIRISA